ncbi:hypothetical protein WN55_04529 [Dufourea novaeangliae]|uniref:Peptidase S8 pro-domain domain-containing protein n=1 Tax=Dufourea novaeangliae TaxID=178035 RepID=A0A154P0X6_DUFNO|nr:hypothetical protein WN55_04529 [Dufourea novaeangliae]
MCPQRIFGLAIVALVALGGRATAYTNQWAMHIEGGPEIAQQVAREHGFQYLDKYIRTELFLRSLTSELMGVPTLENFWRPQLGLYMADVSGRVQWNSTADSKNNRTIRNLSETPEMFIRLEEK